MSRTFARGAVAAVAAVALATAFALGVVFASWNPFESDEEWWPVREGRGGDLVASTGRLEKQDRCFYLLDPGTGTRRLLVFPEGDHTYWDEERQSLRSYGIVLHLGANVRTGGTILTEAAQVAQVDWVRKPAKECALSGGVILMMGFDHASPQ